MTLCTFKLCNFLFLQTTGDLTLCFIDFGRSAILIRILQEPMRFKFAFESYFSEFTSRKCFITSLVERRKISIYIFCVFL